MCCFVLRDDDDGVEENTQVRFGEIFLLIKCQFYITSPSLWGKNLQFVLHGWKTVHVA